MQAIKQFFKTHPHAWWGFYLPVYLAAFFIIEHFITDNYWATQTVLDSYVPFCEWFIFPYVSWSPLLVVLGVYLILKDGEGFRRYMWYIMVTFTTAVVFCILIPNGQDLRPAVMEHHNLAAWLWSTPTPSTPTPTCSPASTFWAAWRRWPPCGTHRGCGSPRGAGA